MENLLNIFTGAFNAHPVWQIIWMIAFFVSIYNFLYCKDRRFVFFTMIASLVWWIHFYSIWLISAWLINLIDVIKNALALKYEKSNKITIAFVLLYLVIWYLAFDWYLSLIPTINAIASTFLVFYIRWVWLNIWFLFVVWLWWVYNFYGQSIWWLSTDISLFVIWIIWIVKILISEKKEKIKADTGVDA